MKHAGFVTVLLCLLYNAQQASAASPDQDYNKKWTRILRCIRDNQLIVLEEETGFMDNVTMAESNRMHALIKGPGVHRTVRNAILNHGYIAMLYQQLAAIEEKEHKAQCSGEGLHTQDDAQLTSAIRFLGNNDSPLEDYQIEQPLRAQHRTIKTTELAIWCTTILLNTLWKIALQYPDGKVTIK